MLKDMIDTIERLKLLDKPPTVYRLHPDDYEALKTEVIWEAATVPNFSPIESFGGLRIVVDPDAPLLPRTAKSP